ncbi:hypothetical protein ACI2UY_22250 [Ralstonia nicotianae]
MTDTIDDELLIFRGVERDMHERGAGLRPRNSARTFRRDVRYDGTWKCDGSVTYGDPTSQAVHAHQLDSQSFDGPGLSFSTDERVARYFATNGGLVSGVVYAVRATHLASLGCRLFYPHEHTSALQNPDEAEVVVVPPMGVELTLCDVVRIIEIE